MITIVCKGYKYILGQLSDISGTVCKITISLKRKSGRKEYEKLWDQFLPGHSIHSQTNRNIF